MKNESDEPEIAMLVGRFNVHVVSGFTAAATLVIALSGPQAAPGQMRESSVDEAAAKLANPDCDFEKGSAQKFIVWRGEAGARQIVICNAEDGRDLSGIAAALSAGIDAGADESAFYLDPRMPELLTLRLSRARIQADPSLTEMERALQLASTNVAIAKLEVELSGKEVIR